MKKIKVKIKHRPYQDAFKGSGGAKCGGGQGGCKGACGGNCGGGGGKCGGKK